MPASTIESIDTHITRQWLKLCAAREAGKPVTEYRQMIDTLLDQRSRYTQETP
jgi:thiaminase